MFLSSARAQGPEDSSFLTIPKTIHAEPMAIRKHLIDFDSTHRVVASL